MKITVPSQGRNPRLFLFGIDCNFTNLVIQALVEAGVTISAIGLPGIPGVPVPLKSPTPPATLPLASIDVGEPGLLSIAQQAAIPVYRFGSLTSKEATSTINSQEGDVLLSVCYPRLIPQRTTRLFPHGGWNVHPSPLPQLRGPDPLFWIFRKGVGHTALTIHKLSSTMDAGAIIAQQEMTVDDCITESALEAQLAGIASIMLTDILTTIQRGDTIQATPQNDAHATYAPFPDDDDFKLTPDMSARTAFNFVRGLEDRGVPITVEFRGELQDVIGVVDYREIDTVPEGITALPFSDGYLLARIRPHQH